VAARKESGKRAPLAPQTRTKDGKREAGATSAQDTPIEIRDLDGAAQGALRAWVYDRLGRQLGKFASQIERVDVRFGDVNGHKGGVDRACMVHVVLSSLPPVVVEIVAESDQAAFDMAAARAERATRRNLEKHGFSTGHKRRNRGKPRDAGLEAAPAELDGGDQREDSAVEHTSERNLKQNTAGMTYALEDSTNGKPSRKSGRRSTNHIKPASGLTIRTKSAVLSPKSNAARSASRGG
jgi:putative sigma-54 modulation protein